LERKGRNRPVGGRGRRGDLFVGDRRWSLSGSGGKGCGGKNEPGEGWGEKKKGGDGGWDVLGRMRGGERQRGKKNTGRQRERDAVW